MTAVKLNQEHEVSSQIAGIYRQLQEQYGFVPNIVKAISNCPELLNAFIPLWAAVYRSPVIGPQRRAIAALGTAAAQQCQYCIGPMTQSALNSGLSQNQIDTICAFDYEELSNEEAAILKYAKVLTDQPDAVSDNIRDELKEYFQDDEIVNITLAIAMYNFTSRVLKGLDVEMDENVSVKPDLVNQPA